MIETIKQLLALQEGLHQDNVRKGFWGEGEGQRRNKGEAIMLMITELSEAVEIHRKEQNNLPLPRSTAVLLNDSIDEYKFMEKYNLLVKNTVEEEMADTAIRLLDYCYGFHYPLPVEEVIVSSRSTGNFAEDVLEVVERIVSTRNENLQRNGCWILVLSHICAFCEWYGIDLLQHVEWKLRYNRGRAFRHGKQY